MKFVIDIDGTLFISDRDEHGNYSVIAPIQETIDKVNELHDKGHEIIISTARHWNLLNQTKEQLEMYGVKYNALNMGKPVGNIYVDDKACLPTDFVKLF